MIFFKKEKEVIELIIRHTDKVEECLLSAIQTLEAYLDDNIDMAKTKARQTDKIETEADMIRHDIRDKLYSGAYMPLLREDIYKLVESLDGVSNSAEKCCDLFLNQRPPISNELKPDFKNIVRTSLGIGEPLKHAVLCYLKGLCPIELSRQHAKDIGLVESEVDKLEWDLTKQIFLSKMDYSHKIHLRLCLDAIVAVSDRAEDTADQLELVTLKAMF
jgi:predicted phosphate transport protein (TIGR00153 family)